MASGSILKNTLLFLIGFLILSLHAEETNTSAPATPPSTVTQPSSAADLIFAPRTPPKVIIDFPKEDSIVKKSTIDISLHIEDGAMPPQQSRFYILLDLQPPILHENSLKPITFKNLAEGGHTLRALSIQPNGLTFPLADSSAAVRFFVKKKNFRNFVDLAKPYITVTSPMGGATELDDKQRVCFDFIVHNATLSKDGYKVRYTLNQREEILDEVKPVYWSDLPPGKHSLLAELIDPSGNPVLGLFSRVDRKFEIMPVLKPLPVRPPNSDDETPPED